MSLNPASPASAQPQRPAPVITAEMRGDILMARKMYREAAEAYKEGPKDSARIVKQDRHCVSSDA